MGIVGPEDVFTVIKNEHYNRVASVVLLPSGPRFPPITESILTTYGLSPLSCSLRRVWFNVGMVCFGINVVILAYLTVWLPHVRGIKVS